MKTFSRAQMRRCNVGIGLGLCGAGIFGFNGLTVQAQPARESQELVSTLIFRATSDQAPLSNFQLPLKQAIPALPIETMVLSGEMLGPPTLRSPVGGSQRLASYSWSVDPTSRLYFSRSGYKSFVARYQYGEDRQSTPYTLHIACHTTDLTPQNNPQNNMQDKMICRLFGNGPLLKGEFQSVGQLSLEGASTSTTATESSSTSSASQAYRRGYELGQLDAQQKLEQRYARHRTEFDSSSEGEFQRGYDNAYSNFTGQSNPSGGLTTANYQGRGAFVVYPTTPQAPEERYILTRVTLEGGQDTTRLNLMTEATNKTVVFQGQLEPTEGGQVLTLKTVDNLPAQGKLFISNKGLLRTIAPIFMGADDQELSVYFRPNS